MVTSLIAIVFNVVVSLSPVNQQVCVITTSDAYQGTTTYQVVISEADRMPQFGELQSISCIK